jgi:hypothetical protein
MDDFEFWSEADWQKACKVGFTVAGGLVGGAFGALASTPTGGSAAPLTIPAGASYGAALGLGAGLLVCPHISKQKAEQFLSGEPMAKADAAQALRAMARISGARSKDEVLRLAATAQWAYSIDRAHGRRGSAASCSAQAGAQSVLASLRAKSAG